MMGSRSKVEAVFGKLRQTGCTDDRLRKVHAPIGLVPNSCTTAEIAVSVAAGILAVRIDRGRPPLNKSHRIAI